MIKKLGLLAACFVAASTLSAQKLGDAVAQIQRERIQSSYVLAFGRAPSADEIKFWAGQNPKSVAELVARHQQYIAQDRGTHEALIQRSYVDALGRNPDAAELRHWMGGNDTYTELMAKHVGWLKGNPAEYEKVIKRSYQLVLGRAPTAAEITYWKGQGTLSYAVLAAAHDDWKRRSGASAPKTSGSASLAPNSSYLTAVTVSSSVLGEIKSTPIVAAGGGNIVAAGGGNIVAAGGGNIVAAGGGNIVAAGGGNLVAAGGGN